MATEILHLRREEPVVLDLARGHRLDGELRVLHHERERASIGRLDGIGVPVGVRKPSVDPERVPREVGLRALVIRVDHVTDRPALALGVVVGAIDERLRQILRRRVLIELVLGVSLDGVEGAVGR